MVLEGDTLGARTRCPKVSKAVHELPALPRPSSPQQVKCAGSAFESTVNLASTVGLRRLCSNSATTSDALLAHAEPVFEAFSTMRVDQKHTNSATSLTKSRLILSASSCRDEGSMKQVFERRISVEP